jgi:membrane-bound serine protease (ClpP class)
MQEQLSFYFYKRGYLFMRAILVLFVTLVLLGSGSVWAQVINQAPEAKLRTAVIIPFHEDINTISGALLKRKFADAADSGVDVIILDIKSPGGYTHTTFELMEMVMDADGIEVVAFIEKEAFSGAALLSLACDKIIMLPGAQMGDAGEIVMGPDGAFRYTEAKSRSALAQKVRDTARSNGRPVALAEKMVDKDMVVFEATHKQTGEVRYFSNKEWGSFKEADQWNKGKPVREAGEDMFFTVNGTRAVELGMATQTIDNRAELAETLSLREPIRVIERTWIDTMVFLLNSGFVTFLLIAIGLIALTLEMSAPGLGVGGLVSVLCFSLFFWSRFLGGTSGWLEVTLFLVGLVFIAAELFVIPGFGIAGIGGISLVLGSLVMASRRVFIPETSEQLTSLGYDVFTVLGAFAGFIVAIFLLSNYIGDIPGLSRLTLKPPVVLDGVNGQAVDPSTEALLPGWQRIEVGEVGETISPLRPSGKMQVGDFTVDVVTEGDFVESGSQVKVIGKQGSRVVVRPV